MRSRIFVLTVLAALVIGGCARKEASQEQATAETQKGMMPDVENDSQSGYEAVPMADVPETPVDGLFINPYFDEAGTQSEVTVTPGQQFSLYIMAETVDPYPTGAAQLRLQMPPGLTVLYTVETDHKLSSLGKYDFSYMVAYDCTPPGRFVIVSYVLKADDDFQGGKIEVLPGFLSDNATFLGFMTCEFTEVRASGGTATIKVKR